MLERITKYESMKQNNTTDSPTTPTLQPPPPPPPSRLKIKGIINEMKKLRSGKLIHNSVDMMYEIQKDENGDTEFVTKNTLLEYKKLFGNNILEYDDKLTTDPYYKPFII